jgi:hypothetical protein
MTDDPSLLAVVLTAIVIPLIIWLYKYYVNKKQHFRNPDTKVRAKCPVGYKQCPSGDCIDNSDPHQTCPQATDAY